MIYFTNADAVTVNDIGAIVTPIGLDLLGEYESTVDVVTDLEVITVNGVPRFQAAATGKVTIFIELAQ